MSQTDILLGLQWGDEGKGKIVDSLAANYHAVARFQGGPNAGHTIELNQDKLVLHQLPSGIFHEKTLNIIGNGVVLDPATFKSEVEEVNSKGIDVSKSLIISNKAQVILPTHKLLDQATENIKGANRIGSTLKGIGPAYRDKTDRCGIKVGNLHDKGFESKYKQVKIFHFDLLEKMEYQIPAAAFKIAEEAFFQGIEMMRSFPIISSEYFLNDLLLSGKKILAEGAQGSLLDIDFGTYPYVTSSTTVAAGACVGLGISPKKIGEIFGVFKAYCTRVGNGPFPTELKPEHAEMLRKAGNEYGATTGRPRRCGWLDLPALSYSSMINGVTQLFMTKADILSNLDILKLCTAYRLPNEHIQQEVTFNFYEAEAVLENLDSWNQIKIDDFHLFPSNFKKFINRIEDFVKIPIQMVSLGPKRDQTVWK